MHYNLLLTIFIFFSNFHFLQGVEEFETAQNQLGPKDRNLQYDVKSLKVELLEIQLRLKQLNSQRQKSPQEPVSSEKREVFEENRSEITPKADPVQTPHAYRPFTVTAAKEEKDFYMDLSVGLDFPGNQEYLAGIGNTEISLENGFSSKIGFGKYFGNFLVGSSIGYRVSDTDTLTAPFLGELKADGKSKVFTHSFSLGYDIFLSDRMSFSLLQSLGWSHADLSLTADYIGELEANGYVLSFGIGFDWKFFFTEYFTMSLGYEFAGQGKNYPFGSSYYHNINSGIGFHF
ncbi:MAG: hypothetical protein ACJZ72_03455 [Opitutales bacterium]